MLGFARVTTCREPQPARWQSDLEERDGASSQPSVTIYRSILLECPGSVLDPNSRARFTQSAPTREEREDFGIEEDLGLMGIGQSGKELMIVAKRGSGVDYEQREDAQLAGSAIREDLLGKTWADIKRERIERMNLLLGSDMTQFTEARYEEIVDKYEHVDEYEWSRIPVLND
jgi:hypothetical protein